MEYLLARLRNTTDLSETALECLVDAVDRTVDLPASADIVREGGGRRHLHVIVDGWAYRYKLLPDGRRHIPALLVPGDVADLDGLFLQRINFGVATLTACRIAVLSHERLALAAGRTPTLHEVLGRMSAVENATAVQWALCLAAMTAEERVAHLFCEVAARLDRREHDPIPFPVTQPVLGDLLGITAVHVSRILQDLRTRGLVSVANRTLVIHDLRALAALGHFDPSYLHRDRWEAPNSA